MSRPTIYEEWELEYIKNNYLLKTYREITNYLNLHNNIKKNENQIRTKAALLGFRKQDISLNRHYFHNIDNEYKAYWLGFIYADGWISKSKTGSELAIELSSLDLKHLEKFKNCIGSNASIKIRNKHLIIANNKNFSDVETCKIRIYSNQMYNDLYIHGVTNSKTYDSNYPKVAENLFRHVLRGYFDGDGCIYTKNEKKIQVHITAYNDFYFKLY